MFFEDLHHAGPGFHRGNLLDQWGERDGEGARASTNVQHP